VKGMYGRASSHGLFQCIKLNIHLVGLRKAMKNPNLGEHTDEAVTRFHMNNDQVF